MGGIGSIAGALAGAGRGYEAAQGRNIPGPAQKQNGGLLMQYLNRRRTQQNAQQAAQLPNPDSAAPKPSLPGGFDAPDAPASDQPMPAPSLQPPTLNGQPVQPGKPPVAVQPNAYAEPMMGVQNRFAQGQVVSSPTTAILGEDGPEAVIPLNGRPDAKLSTANLPQMKYRRGGC